MTAEPSMHTAVSRSNGGITVLTGAGGSIGTAIFGALQERGHRVLRLSHRRHTPDDVVVDFRDDAALIEALEAIQGPIANVIVNHGMNSMGSIDDLKLADWREVLDVNLTSTFCILRTLIPKLEAGSAIVAVSSVAGLDFSRVASAGYSVSKWGLNGLVRHLAVELGPRQIRVNAVCPGIVDNDFTRKANTDESLARGIAAIPLRRAATPDDVAKAVMYLISDSASFVTGILMPVAGGTHR